MTGPQTQRDPIYGVLPGVALFVVIGILMLALLADSEQVEVDETEPVAVAEATEEVVEVTEEPVATEEVVEATEEPAGGEPLDPAMVSAGEMTYAGTCSACHGFDATGIPGLGKNLVESEFMDGLDEASFVEFVNTGRDSFDPLNTTGVAMPPKGGNPALTDEDIMNIWAYLSSLRGAGAAAAEQPAATEEAAAETEEPAATEEATETEEAAATEEASTTDETEAVVVSEVDIKEVYNVGCAGCHGLVGEGAEGFGPALDMDMSADDLYAFLTEALPMGEVDINEEFPHPPAAAPYTLTDEQLQELADYVLSLGG